jgi:hypothetical protein
MTFSHSVITDAAVAGLEILTGISGAQFAIARSKTARTRCTAVFADIACNEGIDIVGEGPTAYVNVRLATVDGDRLFAADQLRSFFDQIGLTDVCVRAGAYTAQRSEFTPASDVLT